MIFLTPSSRQRLLLFTAIDLYEKNAKAVTGTLQSLNLSVMEVETAQSRCGIAKNTLEKENAGKPVSFTQPVVVTLRDCLALYYKQTEALKKKEAGLQAGTAETEELQTELKALHMELADQTTLPLDHQEPEPAQLELSPPIEYDPKLNRFEDELEGAGAATVSTSTESVP